MSAIGGASTSIPRAVAPAAGAQPAGAPLAAPTAPAAGQTVSGGGDAEELAAMPADVRYPTLLGNHVALFRAIGTPEDAIAVIAGEGYTAMQVESFFQDEIMRNPEGWDARMQLPTGRTRQGLEQALPGMPLGGRPPAEDGPMTSLMEADGTGDAGFLKGAAVTGLVGGVGLLAWKLIRRGKGGGDEAVRLGLEGAAGGAATLRSSQRMNLLGRLGGAGEGSTGLTMAALRGKPAQGAGASQEAQALLLQARREVAADEVALAALTNGSRETRELATLQHGLVLGHGPADPELMGLTLAARHGGFTPQEAMDFKIAMARATAGLDKAATPVSLVRR